MYKCNVMGDKPHKHNCELICKSACENIHKFTVRQNKTKKLKNRMLHKNLREVPKI